ncbi:MAG: oxygen-independent coproporphyrinogen III oxidase [Zymomonas mobilis]|uniref:Coproporphyrinogen-III oxidase n=1 Tax=Zymomonas mobilis TaxID=542 RepID=A0A542W290_ZYMMB|nr:oxygen-independent coproporphyrinogen III oxidase [Zymomonas mobilis]TQL17702.1 anaerobic coproporphyrinogen III oxidase [Zymomonas mobilis]
MTIQSPSILKQNFIDRYAGRNVPRYTSYPTAADFHNNLTSEDHRLRLKNIAPKSRISIYLHVPFCQQLCHYCGCHTKVVRRQEVIDGYVGSLVKEIETIGELVPSDLEIGHLSWGGGTPSIIGAAGIRRVMEALQRYFHAADDMVHAMELDPRLLDAAFCRDLFDIGVNRTSLGVQDFNPHIQKAIGRIQPVEQVQKAIADLRAAGIEQVNFDLLYGLPYQGLKEIAFNCEETLRLSPDRIACFGYAHLPERKANQKLIDEKALPQTQERFEQAAFISEILQQQGYQAIGIDHFAKADDQLAIAAREKRLRRNFQGYTTDNEPVLIGLGASAISTFSDAYIQNIADIKSYSHAIEEQGLASFRGIEVTAEDRLRGEIISALMCHFCIDLTPYEKDLSFEAEKAELDNLEKEGLISFYHNYIEMTEAGRPFVRIVAAIFDIYRRQKKQGFSRAI